MSPTDAPMPQFRPGDKVRVLVDEPYSTELVTGDVVTVIEQTTKVEANGQEMDVVRVNTAKGIRWLGLDVVAPFVDDYTPAEKDEVIDAQFRALFDADEDLTKWAADAATALGSEEEKLSSQLTPADGEHEVTQDGHFHEVGQSFQLTDFAGDSLEVHYAEKQCPEHGREGVFFVAVNDEDPVAIPAPYIGHLVAFLMDRARFSKRPE